MVPITIIKKHLIWILYSIGIILIIGGIVAIFLYRKKKIREYTDRVLRYLSLEIDEDDFIQDKPWFQKVVNTFQPPFYSYQKVLNKAQTSWEPLELNYKSLLVEKDDHPKLGLRDGLFLVIDPFDRIGLIDLFKQKMVNPHIFPARSRNIYLLLKLALNSCAAK
jgi:hypothetical protein